MVDISPGSMAMYDEAAELYQSLTNRFIKSDSWAERYSENYTAKRFHDFVVAAYSMSSDTEIQRIFEEMVSHLESVPPLCTVYLIIWGLDIKLDSLELGLLTMTQLTSDKISVIKQRLGDATNKAHEWIHNEFIKDVAGKVLATYQVEAEPDRASERAVDEARRVLDLLRYAAKPIHKSPFPPTILLQGDAIKSHRWAGVSDNYTSEIKLSWARLNKPILLEISDDCIPELSRLGVFEVSAMLKKPRQQLTDFENILLRGLHWFSSAQQQDEVENKVLNLMTCIETYLTPRDGSPIVSSVSENAALILGRTVAERKYIKRQLKGLYQVRSGISHGGQKSVSDIELGSLENLAGSLTMKLVERAREFESQKDLLTWLEERRLQ